MFIKLLQKSCFLVVFLILASCGGGGSSTTENSQSGAGNTQPGNASVQYVSGNSISIDALSPVTIQPIFSGAGNGPICERADALPKGLTISANCMVSGVPVQAGNFGPIVYYRFPEDKSTSSIGLSVLVKVPQAYYVSSPKKLGDVENLFPLIDNKGWNSSPDIIWRYRVFSNTNPEFSVDQNTGRVSGIFKDFNRVTIGIQATISNNYGSIDLVPYGYDNEAQASVFSYRNNGNTGVGTAGSYYSIPAYVSQSFSASVVWGLNGQPGQQVGQWSKFGFLSGDEANATSSSFKDGLTINENTGEISGKLQNILQPYSFEYRPYSHGSYLVGATVVHNGISHKAKTRFKLETKFPVNSVYPTYAEARVGSQFSMKRIIEVVSPIPTNPTYIYEVKEGICDGPYAPSVSSISNTCKKMPLGLTINRSTGEISGIPLEAGFYRVDVGVKIVNEGISWDGFSQALIVVK